MGFFNTIHMKTKGLVYINFLVLAATIWWNYYANTGAINGQSMGSLSDAYANFFTPAGYAFSIWGIIYISLIGNAVYLLRHGPSKDTNIQAKWFTLANIGNCAWVYLWLMEYTGLSVIAMIFILTCLTSNVIQLKIGQSKKPFWLWWASSIYFGWIVVALVANISAYLAKIEWSALLAENIWSALLIVIATGIYMSLVLIKHLTYSAYVGVWALVAIMVKQWQVDPLVQYTALVAALALFVIAVSKDYQLRRKGIY